MDEINVMILQLLAGAAYGSKSSCTRKVAHVLEVHAQMESSKLNGRGPHRTTGKSHKVAPYACTWCFQWHVGRRYSLSRLRHLAKYVMSRQERRGWREPEQEHVG